MLNSPVLDLVILLTFMYFTGSLILSTITEALAGMSKSRGKDLKTSLENLIFDPQWKAYVNSQIFASPHIQSLMSSKDSFPSYIPSQNFVLAVIGEIGASKYNAANLDTAINTNTNFPPEFKTILANLAAQAGFNLALFEKNLAGFYDNAMDRAGGVYKRKSRGILLGLGFVLAFCMNLDTIQIAEDALTDKQQLGKTADNIVSQIPAIKTGKGQVTITTKDNTIAVSNGADTSAKNADIKKNVKDVHDLVTYLSTNSGISIGYRSWPAFTAKWSLASDHLGDFFLGLFGIILTAFALQLNSSFWFDLMNKAVNIRAAGKKPESDKK